MKLFRKEVTSTDTIAPTVRSVILTHDGSDWTAVVDASDASHIDRIDVTQVGQSGADLNTFPVTGNGPFTLTFGLPGVPAGEVAVMVTVHDKAGNITTATGKGFLISSAPTGSMSLNDDAPTVYGPLVAIDSSHVKNARELRVSIDNGATWSEWRPFAQRYVIPLPDFQAPGTRAVSAQYRNDQPGVLEVSDAIELAALPLDSSYGHTLALTRDGKLWAWGDNAQGQLGNGTTAEEHSPIHISDGWGLVSVSDHHSLALDENGALWAWGGNDFGELGIGTDDSYSTPIQVGSGSWLTVSAGSSFSTGIMADGTLWGWGHSDHHGDSTTSLDQLTPIEIGGGATDWIAVSARGTHAVALKADGSLWAWGFNYWGELGDGTHTPRYAPVRVGDDNDWVAVATGSEHTIALKADASLWTWGSNDAGQLGGGVPFNAEIAEPTRVGPDSDWLAIAAGYQHSLALKADGTLWTWGHDWAGQLGDGMSNARNQAYQVAGEWAAVSAGGNNSMAIKTDGTLWSWGLNWNGQVGDGTTTNRRAPLEIGLTLVPSFTVTSSAGPGGAIGPSGAVSVIWAGEKTFTITPNVGYRITDLLADGVSVGPVTTYTFSNVVADHTLTASFELIPGAILGSPDAGVTWNSPLSTAAGLYGVDYSRGFTTRIAVGGAGTIYSNDGSGWTLASPGSQANLYGVSCEDGAAGAGAPMYAVGANGVVLVSTNGGPWISRSSGTTATLRGAAAIHYSGARAWVVGDQGTILASTDGGNTWTPESSDTSQTLRGVCFADEQHGWAVGDGGTILHTSNGGDTWTVQSSGTAGSLYGVACADTNHAWAVGEHGTILVTTNSGGLWNPQASGVSVDLRAVAVDSSAKAIATGDAGTILETLDGASWTLRSSGVTGTMYGVCFAGEGGFSSPEAWAVGW